jgi:hypothetical protein
LGEVIELKIANGILVTKSDALADTPTPSKGWRAMNADERHEVVTQKLFDQPLWDYYEVEVAECRDNGSVILSFQNDKLSSGDRGDFLREIEGRLKHADLGLVVYLQPKVDKNTLRSFRGISIK